MEQYTLDLVLTVILTFLAGILVGAMIAQSTVPGGFSPRADIILLFVVAIVFLVLTVIVALLATGQLG